MQRCFFFLFWILLSINSTAQNPDILKLELSIWVEEISLQNIPAKAKITVNPAGNKEITLDFFPQSIDYIRLREGRLKQDLTFSHSGNKLTIQIPETQHSVFFQFEISYTIDLNESASVSYISRGTDFLALNLQNLYLEKSVGTSGMFFPSLSGDVYLYLLNLSLPKNLNSGTHGEMQFAVESPNLSSHYWKSTKQLQAGEFFLIIGDFKEFDAEEIAETYELSAKGLTEVMAQQKRIKFKAFIKFLKNLGGSDIDDEYLAKLDSIVPHLKGSLYLTAEATGNNEIAAEKAIALEAFKQNEIKAEYALFLYYKKQKGKEWADNFINEKWETAMPEPSPQIIQIQLMHWLRERDTNVFTAYFQNTEINADSCTLNFITGILQSNIPHLIFNYQYKNGTQNIYVHQDTALARALNIPVKVEIHGRDTVQSFEACIAAHPQDTLTFPIDGSPMAVLTDLGKYAPIQLTVNRPDMYNLHLLTNAQNREEKVNALRNLFKSSNANLFSTALGIAMDDENPQVRLEALLKADNLQPRAQLKLKDTLIRLAEEDKNEKVRQKAIELVSKYYGDK